MIETIQRPPVEIGRRDWRKYPEDLFIKAIALVHTTKNNPIAKEALQMLVGLKRQESVALVT